MKRATREAEAASAGDTLTKMKATRRWLVHRAKVPHYANGSTRSATDTPEDQAQLVSYDEACDARAAGGYDGIGFALGPDGNGGHWQGIDLDDIKANGLASIADSMPGYVERSPSGNGAHAIGYGERFDTLGANGSGIEAYAAGRYFTVTERAIRHAALIDLAPIVRRELAAQHSNAACVQRVEPTVDGVVVEGARNDFLSRKAYGLRKDGASVEQIAPVLLAMNNELCSPPLPGAEVRKIAKGKERIKPDARSAEAVSAGTYELGWARKGGADLSIEYLIDPWLPCVEVVGVYGRGEAGKSSWCAQLCADVSSKVTTLWISSEERPSWIKQRHLSCRGEPGTLATVEALPTRIDPATGKALASTFNVYEHLEGAILTCIGEARSDRPLRVAVLDAVVALVTWGKGESANDDTGIKRLCAYLLVLAEKYALTILMLGHVNKGIKGSAANYEYIADAVTGGAAWTNSPRLSFILRKDPAGDFEGHVRTAKSNLGAHFGAHYTTVPVYTLRQRPDGHCDVLCGVQMADEVVWGEKALRAMMGMDDAEHDGRQGSRKQGIVTALVDAMLAALRNGPTTREAVMHEHLLPMQRTVVSRRHWQAADLALAGAHGVQITKGAHGVNQYALPPSAEPT